MHKTESVIGTGHELSVEVSLYNTFQSTLKTLQTPSYPLHFEGRKEAYSSLSYKHRTATGTHVPYGITQCYLPPGRGDITALTPAN